MSKITDEDLKKYGNAIKEIGDVALKHAKNNPAGAQFLLELTTHIHGHLLEKEMMS